MGILAMRLEPDERAGTNGCPPAAAPAAATHLPEHVLEAILAEQRRDWLNGQRTPVATWLEQHPAVGSVPALAAELVYHEFSLRQELGESPEWGEYLLRFPQYMAVLRLLRQADEVVGETLVKPAASRPSRCRDYELLEEVGRGGMGIVYKARHRSLDRVVALKMIRSGGQASDEERRRFQAEARAVARLHHPNIVHIYEVGEADGEPFLALEFVEGQSLARRLGGVPLGPRPAACLMEVLARAVDYAHGMGVIHRDLNPSNVLVPGLLETALDGCVPKITDFGLAKMLDATRDTRSGALLGTPSYMAPEQAASRTAEIDARTDVYGLGALLYELLTGRPPFRAESPLQTLQQVAELDPARPRLLNAAVPRDLETICLKCLEKDPRRRYPSAAAMANDLRRWLRGEPVQARRVGPLGFAWRWCRRKPVIAGLAAGLIVSVVGGFSGILHQWRSAETARRDAVANAREARQILGDLVRFGPDASIESIDLISCVPQPPDIEPLLRAEAHYGRLFRECPGDTDLRVALTKVRGALGKVYCLREQMVEAEACFQRARELWEGFSNDRQEGRDWLACTQFWQSMVAASRGDYAQEFALKRGAHILWQQLAVDQPDDPGLLQKVEECRQALIHGVRVGIVRQESLRALETEADSLGNLVRERPSDRGLRHRLAQTCVLLGEYHFGKHSADQARLYWSQGYAQYRVLTMSRRDDLPARLALAHCCSRLMRNQASDPYYREAVTLIEEAGPYLAALSELHPSDDKLRLVLLDHYCFLARCHANAGATAPAQKTCRDKLLVLAKAFTERAADPRSGAAPLEALMRLCGTLRDAGQVTSARKMSREVASLASRYDALSLQDPGFSRWLGGNAVELATVLRHVGDPAESLHQAERALKHFERLRRASPTLPSNGKGVSVAWLAIGKARWDLGQPEEAVAALLESAAAQRRVFDLAPDVEDNRERLSRCYGRLSDCGGHRAPPAVVATALLEQEKLWPDNAKELAEVSEDFRKLAEVVGHDKARLSPEELAEQQGYLAQSDRLKHAAEAVSQRAEKAKPAAGEKQ
jgi:tetratricopeptide (TPR) repeat protein